MSITHKNTFCNGPYTDLNYLLGIYNHAYIEIGFTVDIYSTDSLQIYSKLACLITLCVIFFLHVIRKTVTKNACLNRFDADLSQNILKNYHVLNVSYF